MNKKIIKLCEVISEDLSKLHKGDTVSALWPFTPNEAEYYIGEFFIKELYETIEKLKKRGYSKGEIAKLFYNPSKIAQYFTLFHSAKILKPNQRKELAEDLMEFLSYYRKDIFCEEGNNRLLNTEFDISNLKKSNVSITNKLSAILLLYLEILYPTMMRMGEEFHGIYEKEGGKIFIKEFFNLDPLSLDLKEKFPVKEVKIVEERGGRIELDFFNHLFKTSKKNSSYILVNKNLVGEEDAKKVYNKIEEKIEDIISKTEKYSRKDWLKVYARGIFYSIKNLKDELNMPNEIPPELFKKIEEEDFKLPIKKIVRFNRDHSREEIKQITKRSFLKIFES